jgi:aspartate kinase
MKIYKFGGASVRDAAGIRHVASIIAAHEPIELLVVVSAIGTTTNALESIVSQAQAKKNIDADLKKLHDTHGTIIKDLFPKNHPVVAEVEELFDQVARAAADAGDSDKVYDQTVSLGEVISSVILSHFLQDSMRVQWIDARHHISTDSTFREGKINWEKTSVQVQALVPVLHDRVVVTQGFIGSDPQGLTTTLGREGSDFSAAIFASCLAAQSVTIWKDVPGVMNADPKRVPGALVFEALPFKEAAEMTYYGASIIHPKTIKPLANKGIPLHVKSFVDPEQPGTVIHELTVDRLPPLTIVKENQCLISCRVTDYSFITEHQIGVIFETLSDRNIKINVMQSSAISFSFCVDFRGDKTLALIERLGREFDVYYNTGLTLVTIKNYDQKLSAEYRGRPGVLLEQSSRSTLQVLVKS